MTRKDQELLAARINRSVMDAKCLSDSEYRRAALTTLYDYTIGLCNDLEAQDTRFDRAKFQEACGFDFDTLIAGAKAGEWI